MNDLVAVDTEIAQIQELMRTDRAAYFRDESKQSRYRDLLVQRQGGLSQAEPDSGGEGLVQIFSQKQYEAQHGTLAGFGEYLKRVSRAADFVFAVPASEREEFKESIENLPDEIAEACFDEMMRPTLNAGLSDPETMSLFAALPEGQIAMREWGHLAARNHATLRARMGRVMDVLEDWQVGGFKAWHDDLSPEAKMAVYRILLR